MLRRTIMMATLMMSLTMRESAADELNYTQNDDGYTCTVSGRDVSGSVAIPEYYDGLRVTGIKDYAFEGNDQITSLHIGDNVEHIGKYAFIGCVNLKTLKLPYNLKSISTNAFSNWSYTYENWHPETVYLNNVAGWCEMDLDGEEIMENPLSAEHLFINGEETTTLDIPEGVTRINNTAFESTKFTEVKFPSTLKKIGRRAFFNCEQLESLDLPGALESIGYGCFDGCNNIKSISFGKGIKYIGQSAFFSDYDEPTINYVSCPDIKTWLGIEFGLDPTLPEKRRDIYNSNPLKCSQHFYLNDENITELTIPEGTEEIKPGAFYRGRMITSVTFPKSLKKIGEMAFSGCPLTSLDLPAGLKYIGEHAFHGCGATSLNIPESVEYIGEGAFRYWKNLKNVTIPRCITEIPSRIFEDCTSLTSVKLHDGIKSIGYSAFSGCPIEDVTLPSDLENIGMGAFSGAKFSIVVIPSGVKTINARVFASCSYLTRIEFPSELKKIENQAFEGCWRLSEVNFPESLERIESRAFSGCTNLKRVDFPESLMWIGSEAFKDTKLLGLSGEIHFRGTTPPEAFTNTFSDYSNTTLYVPTGSLERYKSHAVWGKFANIQEEVVSKIDRAKTDETSFEAESDGIRINSTNGEAHVEVYSLTGARLYAGATGFIALPQGWYIIVIDGNAHKVMVR